MPVFRCIKCVVTPSMEPHYERSYNPYGVFYTLCDYMPCVAWEIGVHVTYPGGRPTLSLDNSFELRTLELAPLGSVRALCTQGPDRAQVLRTRITDRVSNRLFFLVSVPCQG